MVNAQEWLDQNYSLEKRSEIKYLDISNKNLEGSLKLQGFTELKKLDCSHNLITSFDYGDSPLEILKANDNLMVNISNSEETVKKTLKVFLVSNNNFSFDKLHVVSFTNLKILDIRNSGIKSIDKFDESKVAYLLRDEVDRDLEIEFFGTSDKAVEELIKKLDYKDQEIQSLKRQIKEFKKVKLQELSYKKEKKLTETKKGIIDNNKIDEDNQEELNNLLELQTETISDTSPNLAKQLERAKKKLNKIITSEEISLLCRLQTELTELQIQEQEQELETKIEIPPKSN